MSTVTELATPDGVMELYEASPDGEPRGAVIVVQEAFGVNDHIQDVTRRFAAAGYHAVAPAFFHRAGGGTAPYDDFTQVMPLFQDVDRRRHPRRRRRDARAPRSTGFRPLDGSGSSASASAVGSRSWWRRDARSVPRSASTAAGSSRPAGLPFPPLIGESSSLQTPWLGLFGDLDKGISIESVEELRAALVGAPVAADIVRYPDADHGFHCDARASYHAESAADAWRRALEWFDSHLA